MGIIIENNVPLPRTKSWKALLDELREGESILFSAKDRNTVQHTASAHFHKFTDKKFTVAADPKDRLKARIWRVK